MGYRIKLGSSNQLKNGPFAGSPEERAEDINAMFADPSVDAIFALVVDMDVIRYCH